MSTIAEIRAATAAITVGAPEGALDYLTEGYLDEFQRGLVRDDDSIVAMVDEHGERLSGLVIPELVESTRTFYGNHHYRSGSCFYWKTDAGFSMCNTLTRASACNWRSVSATFVQTCPGGWGGYRYVFTY